MRRAQGNRRSNQHRAECSVLLLSPRTADFARRGRLAGSRMSSGPRHYDTGHPVIRAGDARRARHCQVPVAPAPSRVGRPISTEPSPSSKEPNPTMAEPEPKSAGSRNPDSVEPNPGSPEPGRKAGRTPLRSNPTLQDAGAQHRFPPRPQLRQSQSPNLAGYTEQSSPPDTRARPTKDGARAHALQGHGGTGAGGGEADPVPWATPQASPRAGRRAAPQCCDPAPGWGREASVRDLLRPSWPSTLERLGRLAPCASTSALCRRGLARSSQRSGETGRVRATSGAELVPSWSTPVQSWSISAQDRSTSLRDLPISVQVWQTSVQVVPSAIWKRLRSGVGRKRSTLGPTLGRRGPTCWPTWDGVTSRASAGFDRRQPRFGQSRSGDAPGEGPPMAAWPPSSHVPGSVVGRSWGADRRHPVCEGPLKHGQSLGRASLQAELPGLAVPTFRLLATACVPTERYSGDARAPRSSARPTSVWRASVL